MSNRLPTQVVKIDQSFTRSIGTHARKRALVETVTKLLQDLGQRLVAEGVCRRGRWRTC
jgi:EAL domain-containing protein (putative c-di-GMP-specific phosphodiesterase class I)